jgi:hypothetical protein
MSRRLSAVLVYIASKWAQLVDLDVFTVKLLALMNRLHLVNFICSGM